MTVEDMICYPAHGKENTLALLLISPSPGAERGTFSSEKIIAFQKSHEGYPLSIRQVDQSG